MRYAFLFLLALSCCTHLSLEATCVNHPEVYDLEVKEQPPLGLRHLEERELLLPVLRARALPTPIGQNPGPRPFDQTAFETVSITELNLKYYAPPFGALFIYREIEIHKGEPLATAKQHSESMLPRIRELEKLGIYAMRKPNELNSAWRWINQKLLEQIDGVDVQIDHLMQNITTTLQAEMDKDDSGAEQEDKIFDDDFGVLERAQTSLLLLMRVKALCAENVDLMSIWQSCCHQLQSIKRNYFIELERVRFSVEMGRQWTSLSEENNDR